MNRPHRLLPAAACLVLLAGGAAADVIRSTSGELVRDVRVTAETMESVTYTVDGEEQTMPSQKVLDVRFERLPDKLGEAEDAWKDEQDGDGALDLLGAFVADNVPRLRTKEKWAPAYAAWRTVELNRELARPLAVVDAANFLVQTFPDSRYVPLAYLAKARAERAAGEAGQSEATLVALDELARTKGLKRWELASRLARLEVDQRPPAERRAALENLAAGAGDFPTIRARSKVLRAESMLAEASKSGLEEARKLRDGARPLLAEVAEDPSADPRSQAGAHTGLAECYYYEGAASEDEEVLRQATLHGLRVACLHREETDYLPKALFFAMRSFDVMKDRGRKADMLGELEGLFPDSPWTAEARKFR